MQLSSHANNATTLSSRPTQLSQSNQPNCPIKSPAPNTRERTTPLTELVKLFATPSPFFFKKLLAPPDARSFLSAAKASYPPTTSELFVLMLSRPSNESGGDFLPPEVEVKDLESALDDEPSEREND